MIDRFSRPGDTILDPFCGCGTFAVEAKRLGRNSINYDVNPVGLSLTKEKLGALGGLDRFSGPPVTMHEVARVDARELPLPDESVDAVITDIPYGNMIHYSSLPDDLSTIEDYEQFLVEVKRAFAEARRVLRPGKYCVMFVCDYRIGAARRILPIHSDVTHFMTRELGFVLFDTYIWRYYRSGGFRPFGRRPFQAMNLHSYILVFYKPDGTEDMNRKNRDVRYRDRLVEKQRSVSKRLE
jgi:DNA modification methylase